MLYPFLFDILQGDFQYIRSKVLDLIYGLRLKSTVYYAARIGRYLLTFSFDVMVKHLKGTVLLVRESEGTRPLSQAGDYIPVATAFRPVSPELTA
jgi:hypothetical protein